MQGMGPAAMDVVAPDGYREATGEKSGSDRRFIAFAQLRLSLMMNLKFSGSSQALPAGAKVHRNVISPC